MNLKERLYISLAHLMPKPYLDSIAKSAKYAGYKGNQKRFIGSVVVFGLLMVFISLFSPLALFGEYSFRYLPYGFVLFFVSLLISHAGLYFKMQQRVDEAEGFLPDVLQLISVNLHAGMTPFAAIKLAGRGEFGCLAQEIKTATTKALGIESFSKSLLSIKDSINSVVLSRVLKLISTSLMTGGHLASLLDELADEIRQTQGLKREMISKTKTYTAFILFTILFGTPVLLAISIHFVSMIQGITDTNDLGDMSQFDLGFMGGELPITESFLIKLSFFMLSMTCFIASMLMGVINKGSMKYGLKYVLGLIPAGLVMFAIARYLVTNMFTTLG